MSNDNIVKFPKNPEEDKDLLTSVDQIKNAIDNSDEFGLDFLDAVLSLDDEEVATVGQQFLWEMDKVFDDEESKIAIAKAVQADGLSLEDFAETYQKIVDEVAGIDELSDVKKDFVVQMFGIIFNKIEKYYDALNQKVIIPTELINDAKLPKYAHEGDGAMDIYALDDYTINPGETKLIPTGIKMAIPQGYGILVQPRSGLSLKSKLRIANTPGLIDSGYRDEIGVIVENIEPPFKDIDYDFDNEGNIKINSILHGQSYTISKGERFAQIRLVQIPTALLQPVKNVKEIGEDRGGGFGSSGMS